jgi:hypothetical protein
MVMWEYGIWDPEPSWGYGLERFHGDMETPELSRGYRDSRVVAGICELD